MSWPEVKKALNSNFLDAPLNKYGLGLTILSHKTSQVTLNTRQFGQYSTYAYRLVKSVIKDNKLITLFGNSGYSSYTFQSFTYDLINGGSITYGSVSDSSHYPQEYAFDGEYFYRADFISWITSRVSANVRVQKSLDGLNWTNVGTFPATIDEFSSNHISIEGHYDGNGKIYWLWYNGSSALVYDIEAQSFSTISLPSSNASGGNRAAFGGFVDGTLYIIANTTVYKYVDSSWVVHSTLPESISLAALNSSGGYICKKDNCLFIGAWQYAGPSSSDAMSYKAFIYNEFIGYWYAVSLSYYVGLTIYNNKLLGVTRSNQYPVWGQNGDVYTKYEMILPKHKIVRAPLILPADEDVMESIDTTTLEVKQGGHVEFYVPPAVTGLITMY